MKIIQYKTTDNKILITYPSDKLETNLQVSQNDNTYRLTNEDYFCYLTGASLIELSREGEKIKEINIRELICRQDMRLAKQDKERQKEIELWDKIQQEDETKFNKNDDNWEWKN